MTAPDLARQAYATQTPMRPARALEYDAFAKVTRDLTRALETGALFARRAEALSSNERLWTFVAAAVADGANALPPETRAGLFYLSEFVRQETRDVLARRSDGTALREINLSVMKGLCPPPQPTGASGQEDGL